uniref:Uncharacterized protein ycf35 n=1 Tax=Vertebrata isogona TaxID=2006944 RepID=A0A1Z1MFP5_9FLOR|nr:hypothetical protein [Vertebrata isogona]ARW64591.1 hypothetical protein [Vertebrata isogona]
MSHFSKIKTSILDLELLQKTILDLGFSYRAFSKTVDDLHCNSITKKPTLFVYDVGVKKNDLPFCSFEWNVDQYLIVVDFALWNLDMDFNYFMDRILQQYAYNNVMNQGYVQGFQRVKENVLSNGSISLTLKRF